MFASILTVCDGNICRSPTAAALFRQQYPERRVDSAGIVALEGHDMATMAREVALEQGVDPGIHKARRLGATDCQQYDLVLVMEQRQREVLMRRYPTASGKIFLLSHWSGAADIPDPWQRDREVYQVVFGLLQKGCQAWFSKLG